MHFQVLGSCVFSNAEAAEDTCISIFSEIYTCIFRFLGVVYFLMLRLLKTHVYLFF